MLFFRVEDPGRRPSADLFVFIQDVAGVTTDGRLVDQGQAALFDDYSGTHTVSNEFDDEETDTIRQLREVKGLYELLSGGTVFKGVYYLLVGCDKTIKIDLRGELLQSLLIVCLSVELEDLDVQGLHVLELHLKLDLLLHLEPLRVGLQEADYGLCCDGLVLLQLLFAALELLQVLQPLRGIGLINGDPLLDAFEEFNLKVFLVPLEGAILGLANLLKIFSDQ